MSNNLQELISHYDGELYNLLYKIVCESKDLPAEFQYVCEHLIKDETDKTISVPQEISESEYDTIINLYGDSIEGILNSVIKTAIYGIIDEKSFYEVLCKKYRATVETDKELAIALELALKDDRIPFVYLGRPLSMEQEEYKERVDNNRASIKKVRYALETDYSQKTEVASAILNVLESISDYEDRVVVLSQLVAIMSNAKTAALKEMLEKLNAAE